MTDLTLAALLDHPLAGFAIAAALCLYHPLALWIGRKVFQIWFHDRLAECNLMKQVRLLGAELSTISMAAMVKAATDPQSKLTAAIQQFDLGVFWPFYAWLAGLYLVFIFSPSIFVRYALLERDRMPGESNRDWSLFVWRWALFGWLLGFVNLHIALKFMAPLNPNLKIFH